MLCQLVNNRMENITMFMAKLESSFGNIVDVASTGGYKTCVKFVTMYGPYEWCGTPDQSGYYLTQNEVECSQMLKVNILMSLKLREDIDNIEIYDETGFLAQYATEKIGLAHQFFFALKYVDSFTKSTDMKIKYVKYLPKPAGSNIFARPQTKIVYEETITIPALETKGDTCSICLDTLDPITKDSSDYLSECKHQFHTKCIFEYINTNNYLKEFTCHKYCNHGKKVKQLNCPNCMTVLEDYLFF